MSALRNAPFDIAVFLAEPLRTAQGPRDVSSHMVPATSRRFTSVTRVPTWTRGLTSSATASPTPTGTVERHAGERHGRQLSDLRSPRG